jgi:hypothetical protein
MRFKALRAHKCHKLLGRFRGIRRNRLLQKPPGRSGRLQIDRSAGVALELRS